MQPRELAPNDVAADIMLRVLVDWRKQLGVRVRLCIDAEVDVAIEDVANAPGEKNVARLGDARDQLCAELDRDRRPEAREFEERREDPF